MGQVAAWLDAPARKKGRTGTWLAADEFAGFQHGYAGTIYKGQLWPDVQPDGRTSELPAPAPGAAGRYQPAARVVVAPGRAGGAAGSRWRPDHELVAAVVRIAGDGVGYTR